MLDVGRVKDLDIFLISDGSRVTESRCSVLEIWEGVRTDRLGAPGFLVVRVVAEGVTEFFAVRSVGLMKGRARCSEAASEVRIVLSVDTLFKEELRVDV